MIPDHLRNRKPRTDFSLQKMEEIYRQSGGNVDRAHRHEYFTVILIKKAQGKHVIDYQTYPFASNEVHFVSPGQIHQVNTVKIPSGWVITFSREFLMQNNIPENFISNINLFKQFGETPPLPVDTEIFNQLLRIIKDMQLCLADTGHYRKRALGALLQLFLIQCSNSCSLDSAQLNEEDAAVCIFRDFKKLVEENFTNWHRVTQYASEIHISSKHLSHTVKHLSGKTAKQFIQDRLTLEAKRLLLHTSLNMKEIAYRLGFSEPLHFSGFIRKQTGLSPSRLRTSQASL